MKTLKKLKNKVVKPAKDFLKRDDSKARRDSQTAGVDPPSRPRSSLGIGSSEPAPLSLQRRGSDGKSSEWWTPFRSDLNFFYTCTLQLVRPTTWKTRRPPAFQASIRPPPCPQQVAIHQAYRPFSAMALPLPSIQSPYCPCKVAERQRFRPLPVFAFPWLMSMRGSQSNFPVTSSILLQHIGASRTGGQLYTLRRGS